MSPRASSASEKAPTKRPLKSSSLVAVVRRGAEVLSPRSSTSSESSAHEKTTPFAFPLSLDHLLTLIQFNVYRAALTHMSILSIPTLSSCDIEPRVAASPVLPLPACLPPALLPTELQRYTPHKSWVDLIPFPAMRDNMIRASGRFDSCALLEDVLGVVMEVDEDDDASVGVTDKRNGLVVWGDPWDVNSWEVEEGFLKKWGWLLEGCEELLAATDRWRDLRGEDPVRRLGPHLGDVGLYPKTYSAVVKWDL
jgi:hypothetical protein